MRKTQAEISKKYEQAARLGLRRKIFKTPLPPWGESPTPSGLPAASPWWS